MLNMEILGKTRIKRVKVGLFGHKKFINLIFCIAIFKRLWYCNDSDLFGFAPETRKRAKIEKRRDSNGINRKY